MSNEITKNQIDLMRHTCGLSTGEKRNWFGTGDGKDADEFDKLVDDGMAERTTAPSWSGDKFIYTLTVKGIEFVKTVTNNKHRGKHE